MFNKALTAMGLALLVSTPALAVEGPFPVREVEANAEFAALENSNALDFYPEVETDIENAIKARVNLNNDDAVRDLKVNVGITAMRLNDNPQLTDDGRFNILEGVVQIFDQDGEPPVATQIITLRAEEMETAGLSISPDNEDFYAAMVDAFAERSASVASDVTELPEFSEVVK